MNISKLFRKQPQKSVIVNKIPRMVFTLPDGTEEIFENGKLIAKHKVAKPKVLFR